jgi:hypothetical protein
MEMVTNWLLLYQSQYQTRTALATKDWRQRRLAVDPISRRSQTVVASMFTVSVLAVELKSSTMQTRAA